MVPDILIPLVTALLAELGDKTQISILFLSSEKRRRLHLLLGVLVAFLVVDGFAVLVGSQVMVLAPLNVLRVLSLVIFVVFGVLKFRDRGVEGSSLSYSGNPFLSGFILVGVAEWGDKTQIASGLLAAKYDALMVLIGTMTGLGLISTVMIWLGGSILSKIDRRIMTKVAGATLILVGISFLIL
ncbi:TMEM165/GDT1 family protein [Candidatus Bathyarchaeota archaeon]|nr:TMEM165/GDT1 family protein [Candidatus Bathyarchaeota archaeon]